MLKLGDRESARRYAFVGASHGTTNYGRKWHVIAKFWADPRRQPKKKGGEK